MMPPTTESLYLKDKNLKHEDVRTLIKWVEEQPHLPELKEYQVILFLHSCYYNTEEAKSALDAYFTIRTRHLQVYKCLNETDLRNTFKYLFIQILPTETPEGYFIYFFKFLNDNPSLFVFSHLISLVNAVWYLHSYQQGFVNGYMCIIDCTGYGFKHLFRTQLSILGHALAIIQEATPVRMKGVHFVNVSSAVEKMKLLAKPFIKTELYNLLHFHSSIESLFKHVPQECLPADYGGKSESVQVLHEKCLKHILENYEVLQWHDLQIVEESKRVLVKPKRSFFGWSF